MQSVILLSATPTHFCFFIHLRLTKLFHSKCDLIPVNYLIIMHQKKRKKKLYPSPTQDQQLKKHKNHSGSFLMCLIHIQLHRWTGLCCNCCNYSTSLVWVDIPYGCITGLCSISSPPVSTHFLSTSVLSNIVRRSWLSDGGYHRHRRKKSAIKEF